MSASIFWRYAPKNNKSLQVDAPSAFVSAMERAFGAPPWILAEGDLEKLRGMSAANGGMDNQNPYEQILYRMIDHDGVTHSVEIWPEY